MFKKKVVSKLGLYIKLDLKINTFIIKLFCLKKKNKKVFTFVYKFTKARCGGRVKSRALLLLPEREKYAPAHLSIWLNNISRKQLFFHISAANNIVTLKWQKITTKRVFLSYDYARWLAKCVKPLESKGN